MEIAGSRAECENRTGNVRMAAAPMILDIPGDAGFRSHRKRVSFSLALLALVVIGNVLMDRFLPRYAGTAALVSVWSLVGIVATLLARRFGLKCRLLREATRAEGPRELARALGSPRAVRLLLSSKFILADLAARLADARRGGVAIRVADLRQLVPIRPLAYPIEPSPLDETDANVSAILEQMRRESVESGDPDGEDATSISDRMRRASWCRRRKRVRQLAEVGILLGVAVIGLWRGVPTAFAGAVLLVVLGRLAVRAVRALVRHDRYERLAVNGGLVLRARAQPRMLTRAASVVVAMRTRSWSTWTVAIADSQSDTMFELTDDELEFFLSAWTSPLPPPPVERLAELAT